MKGDLIMEVKSFDQKDLFKNEKPNLPEKITYLSLCQYSVKYVDWKTSKNSTIDSDSDDIAISGEELMDFQKIQNFLQNTQKDYISIMGVSRILYNAANFRPDTEGRAKNVVMCAKL